MTLERTLLALCLAATTTSTYVCAYASTYSIEFDCYRVATLQQYNIVCHKYMLAYYFRIIDLGVMTPCDKILKTARDENAGMCWCVCI